MSRALGAVSSSRPKISIVQLPLSCCCCCCCKPLFFFAGCTGKFAFSPRAGCPQLSQKKRIWCDDRKNQKKKKKEDTQPMADLEASIKKKR